MVKKLHKKKLLKRAEEHIFSTGVEDAASSLSRANMRYGIAKMHFVQKEMGKEPDATFISSPDETCTRNVSRWNQGISYGGRISWGNGKDSFTILDVKPNACGMLVGGINKIPNPRQVIKAVAELEKGKDFIKNIQVHWDFWKGNHFIDVFEVKSSLKLPKHAVILHAGCPELKADSEHGCGLYFNESKTLQEMSKIVKTPFGKSYVLEGSNAKEYIKFYKFADDFAKKRRELAFRKIFGGKVICNRTHQGMVNKNEIMLGCHVMKDFGLYPVSIKADLPSYLFKGKKNFTKKAIEDLGFSERAQKYGVYNRLKNANILPHGGGYLLEDSLSVDKVFEVNGRRYFQIEMKDGMGKKIVSDIRELQFAYRSREVVKKTVEIGLGEIKAELIPVYTVKI